MEEVKVRPLRKGEEEGFRELTTHYIGSWYDDIDESFAQIILDAHNEGFDPLGYFTKTKTIWVADIGGEMCGFLVGTEKRGGSVKFAPEIIKPEYQRKGLGTKLWQEVEEIYRKKGARKIYNHAPLHRFELLSLAVKLGLRLEAHLKEHYRKGQDEYVAGKLLKKTKPASLEPTIWGGRSAKYSVRDYRNKDKEQLRKLILEEMPRNYEEIDPLFFESVIQAEKHFKDSFRKKGKKVFVVEAHRGLVGCCVATPKRGGAVKLVPFLFYPEKADFKMGIDLLTYIENFFREIGYRKLYAPIPIYEVDCCKVFRQCNFEVEGLLREPYKPGVDNIFFGKLIQKQK